ncbi:thioredoxin-like protein [Apodospora peruviana]|uniref:Thioredoxin-like protein n=1 Tax=Apodospora peruviana TaxID=516989 RepID=A0AAE0IDA7_9PEZI|nr:thioredoxin-like protein [Apodospora peruviana]
MSNPTPAQEEFANFLSKNTDSGHNGVHPEDRDDAARDAAYHSEDEEDRYRASQVDAAMRMPTFDATGDIKLPPASFDSGCSTGVKGVIADARSYESARRSKWKDRVRAARRSVFGIEGGMKHDRSSGPESEGSGPEDLDEDSFIAQWRESRRRELEAESRAPVRNRRTSPSVRIYGRMEDVDALGYLDAIEKVGRETVVVVFVYDHECLVSGSVESALKPLVSMHPTVRFVKVHYEDIEFDNAGVPAILAYRNQGDLFANLTGMVQMIPDDEDFDSNSLKKLFMKHHIL